MTEPTNIDELEKIGMSNRKYKRKDGTTTTKTFACKKGIVSLKDLKQMAIRSIDKCRKIHGKRGVTCGKYWGRCEGCKRLMRFANLKESDLNE